MGSTGQSVDLTLLAGLPYSRSIRIVDGKTLWDSLDLFEARMQIRSQQDSESTLKYDFTPHLNSVFDANDIVISWDLSGAETRDVRSGYYDLIVSDSGTVDSRALRIIFGYLRVDQVVTASAGAL